MSLAIRIPSASSSNGMIAATGPNTSSRATRSELFASTSVHGNQKPGPDGTVPLNIVLPSTNDATSSRCEAEMSGPMSVPSASGSPTLKRLVASVSSWVKRS